MALSVSSNFAISASYASNSMRNSQTLMGKSINRISSGNKAFKPSDDLHSFIAGTKLKGEGDAYAALGTGVQDAGAKLNYYDSVLSNAQNALLQMKSAAMAYRSAASGSDEASAISKDFGNMKTLANAVMNSQYKGEAIYGSAITASLKVYMGLGSEAITIGASVFTSVSGLASALALTIVGAAATGTAGGIAKINAAIKGIAAKRADLGANISALEQISNYLSDIATASDASYKAVTEVDMAREMTTYVASNIQSQAAQAMVAQSNQSLAQVLNLLQV